MLTEYRDFNRKHGFFQTLKKIHHDAPIKYEEWFGPDPYEKLTAKENFIWTAMGMDAVEKYRNNF